MFDNKEFYHKQSLERLVLLFEDNISVRYDQKLHSTLL